MAFNEAFQQKGVTYVLLLLKLTLLQMQSKSGVMKRRLSATGLKVDWPLELYGELLHTGGGKERMTRHFTVRLTAPLPSQRPTCACTSVD